MKTWYLSKTLWVNLIAAIVLIIQTRYGFVIEPEAQAGLLTIINMLLRAITKTPLDWRAPTLPDINPGGPDSGQAGFVNLRFLVELFLIGCALLMLAACATTSPTAPVANDNPQILAGKSLLAVKASIVAAATATDALCKQNQLSLGTCIRASELYEQSKPAYVAAVDAYLLMSTQGGDPAEFGRTLQRLQGIAGNMLQLTGGTK